MKPSNDSMKLKFNATLILRDPDGREVLRRQAHNLVTTAGKDAILQTAAPVYVKAFCYLGIGSDATAPAAGQTALLAELARSAAPIAPTFAGHALTFVETFGAGVGTGTITEAALLTAAAAGTMFNRLTFAGIAKAAGQTLEVTIDIS
jgi:hypothetical protein